jgi:hypothetical protein
MTVRIVPFQAKHVAAFVMQRGLPVPIIPLDLADFYARTGPALSAMDASSNVIAALGLLPHHDSLWRVWHLVGYRAPLHMVALHRAALGLFQACPSPRLELLVDAGFSEHARWAKLLGFKCESPRLDYLLPGGRAGYIYSRIRH